MISKGELRAGFVKRLEKEMYAASDALDFEKAAKHVETTMKKASQNWAPAYAWVNGRLPLDELALATLYFNLALKGNRELSDGGLIHRFD